MKTSKICTYLVVSVMLLAAVLGGCAPMQQSRAVSYDSSETMSKNMVDALIAMANAQNAGLTDVLFVDGDRDDDYTADGSMAQPYKTIATANAAAASGDVIIVAPGAYSETVTITTGASLFGWNVTGTTLTGNYVLVNGGTITINAAIAWEQCTVAADDVTPDVTGCQILTTSANTGATAITDLDNPVVGSVVYLVGGSDTNSSTIADSGNFALNTAWTASADDVLILYVQADNDYVEVGRVDN